MTRMQIKRITADIDLNRLSFADLARVSGAIATLEKIGADGGIVFTTETINGAGRLRHNRQRSDADGRPIWERPLQPGPQKVLDHMLATDGWHTAEQIAAALGMKDSTVRPHLVLLKRRGAVDSKKGPDRMKLWCRKAPDTTPMIEAGHQSLDASKKGRP